MFEIITTCLSYVYNGIWCYTKVQRRPGRRIPAVLNKKIDDYDTWRGIKN
jgi:hypothetical protein